MTSLPSAPRTGADLLAWAEAARSLGRIGIRVQWAIPYWGTQAGYPVHVTSWTAEQVERIYTRAMLCLAVGRMKGDAT